MKICTGAHCTFCNQQAQTIWQEGTYSGLECPEFGLIFCRPDENLSFDESYFASYQASPAVETARINHFKRLISEVPLELKAPILDIGAGVGLFYRALPSELAEQTWLVEPSDYARHVLENFGHKRITASVDELEAAPKFATITLWDVLAHVPNPLEMLISLREHMTTDARLIIKTPHHPPDLFRLSGLFALTGKSHSIVHIPSMQFHFTPESLKKLLVEAGFELVNWQWVSEADTPNKSLKGRMLMGLKRARLNHPSFINIVALSGSNHDQQ